LIRPEPQAVWSKQLSPAEWQRLHHIKFKGRSATSGEWIKKSPNIPERWHIEYKNPEASIKFRLALTSFKHVGIFPEQAVNWDYITACLKKFKTPEPKVLNLFAYTGGASLIARAAGADTTHVDSIKQVVTWANENQELSGLIDIRWVVEDALKFVKRELKRGKKYNGIILDPPAYGHGPNGEKWKLEDNIQEMMREVIQLLDPVEHFLILNTYSLGFSSVIIENLIKITYPQVQNLETGELYLQATAGPKLPLGVFGKFCKLGD
jgi:23S rRNA (cytosine1962-C5)-methyltransferase